ncbi:MAG: hypothetical protein ACRDFS_10345, partial [Chloroflexota bacterium]
MKILLSAVIPLLFLAGCGSSGANVSLSQTSANLKQAIDSYNQTKPAGLAAQGSACKTAAAALPSHTFRVSD